MSQYCKSQSDAAKLERTHETEIPTVQLDQLGPATNKTVPPALLPHHMIRCNLGILGSSKNADTKFFTLRALLNRSMGGGGGGAKVDVIAHVPLCAWGQRSHRTPIVSAEAVVAGFSIHSIFLSGMMFAPMQMRRTLLLG